jgi:UDP-N-acetylglucosamine 3-dehydrogenase
MKVGIIGCGGIAPLHIRVYKKLKNVTVVSLCDLNKDRALKLAKEFRISNTYSNYWDMFEKEGLDLVDICTPVSTHAKIVCDAAEAVPAILVEKPMALNISQCDEIINKTKKCGTRLCIGQNQIFSPHIQKAKSITNSEKFNLLCFSTMQKESFEILRRYNLAPPWNVLPEQRGIIWEVCCHLAYLQLFFLPDIKEVYAVGSKAKYPVYDDFAVLLRTEGERFGIIDLSWISNETETIYELRDTTGKRLQIHWEFDYSLETNEEPPFTIAKVVRNIYVEQKRLWQKWLRFASCYFHKGKLTPTSNLITKYVESIEKDLPSPVTGEYGRKTVSLLEAIEQSLNQHRAISLAN